MKKILMILIVFLSFLTSFNKVDYRKIDSSINEQILLSCKLSGEVTFNDLTTLTFVFEDTEKGNNITTISFDLYSNIELIYDKIAKGSSNGIEDYFGLSIEKSNKEKLFVYSIVANIEKNDIFFDSGDLFSIEFNISNDVKENEIKLFIENIVMKSGLNLIENELILKSNAVLSERIIRDDLSTVNQYNFIDNGIGIYYLFDNEIILEEKMNLDIYFLNHSEYDIMTISFHLCSNYRLNNFEVEALGRSSYYYYLVNSSGKESENNKGGEIYYSYYINISIDGFMTDFTKFFDNGLLCSVSFSISNTKNGDNLYINALNERLFDSDSTLIRPLNKNNAVVNKEVPIPSSEISLSRILINDEEIVVDDTNISYTTKDYQEDNASLKLILSKGKVDNVSIDDNIIQIENDIYSIPLGETGSENHVLINLVAEDGITKKTYYLTIIRGKSSDSSLKKILFESNNESVPNPVLLDSEGNSISGFNSKVYEYTIGVSSLLDSILIKSEASNSKSIIYFNDMISNDGNYIFDVSNDSIKIKVVAENGDFSIYTFKIKKLSDNTNITEVKVFAYLTDNSSILLGNADKEGESFNLTTNNSLVKSVYIEAICEDNKASVEYLLNSYSFFQVITETGQIGICVTSESGIQKEYVVNITKESLNPSLDMTITVKGNDNGKIYLPTNDSTYDNYIYYVPRSEDKVNVIVDAKDENTIVTGQGTYDVPTDRITISLTSKDGDKLIIIISIITDKDDDNTIDSILILDEKDGKNLLDTNGTPFIFNKSQTSYELVMPYSQKYVYIDVLTASSKAKVNLEGNIKLDVGINSIYIFATSESGIKGQTYSIRIIRESPNDDSTLFMIKIDGIDLEGFNPSINTYVYYVSKTTDKVNIDCILNSTYSSTDFENGEKTLTKIHNIFQIKVVAESGVERVYSIDIVKAENKNTIINIDIYNINNQKINNYIFNKDIKEYSDLQVPFSYEKLRFEVSYDGEYGTIYGDGLKTLSEGLNFFEIYVESEAEVKGEKYSFRIYRASADKNNYLSSLEVIVNGNNVISNFDKEINRYIVYVPAETESIRINAISEGEYSLVSGNGLVSLHDDSSFIDNGNTSCEVIVTSEYGEERIYSLVIYEQGRELSKDNTIQSIVIKGNDGDIYFQDEYNENLFEYSVSIPYRVSSISVIVSSNASITGAETYVIESGITKLIEVYATSDSGEVGKKYSFLLFRENANDNTFLKTLCINGIQLKEFDKTKQSYSLEYKYEVSNISLSFETENKNATCSIKFNGEVKSDLVLNLKEGNNTVNITVYADNNAYRTYSLSIFREYRKIDLLDLQIKDHDLLNKENMIIAFDPKVYEYNVHIPYEETSIEIIAAIEDSNFNVEISKCNMLKVGDNLVYVRVISNLNPNVYTQYIINVNRELKLSSNINIYSFSIKENVMFEKEFSDEISQYSIEVNSNIQKLNFNIEFEYVEDEAKPTIQFEGADNLSFGENIVTVTITSSDKKAQKVYKLKVYRKDVTLSQPQIDEIKEFTFDFRNDVNEYTYQVPSTTSMIHLSFIVDNEDTTYVLNNDRLMVGKNDLRVDVYSKNVKVKTIYLTIYRTDGNVSTSITPFIVGGVVGGTVIISGVAFVLIKKRKMFERERKSENDVKKTGKTLKK